ncbi:protein kinase [Nocardia puris]|uniref:serine/threonine-protein kinase n=1 Tax=Nocardia puris TaxID=208602 RepID=UPI00189613ED|nr:serine/threonine-protein kinase [Nocardia puris]MBF6210948.1 protein kinase [Nocardia puris]MBF6364544.1 protein kinase [Nocardia puris]MBF6459473.1 protein kinase [Nocardia puris]
MLASGEAFAGYVIERQVGRGGMGSVYLAKHPRLPRMTALKLLNREMFFDKEVRARFEREADLVARLDHPNIVTVYDRGLEDEQLWISMQYIDGVDAASVDPKTLPPARAVQIIAETADALDYAHGMGVLHRDVKPANILLARSTGGRGERVFLTDFGIARLRDDTGHLTQTGTFTATLAYASPEQLTGASLDHRSDQYSLACTLFWLFTGSGPFAATNPAQVIQGHLQSAPPPLSSVRPGLPNALDGVLAKAMAKRPDDRFDSCSDFAAAAKAALSGQSMPAMPLAGGPVTGGAMPYASTGGQMPVMGAGFPGPTTSGSQPLTGQQTHQGTAPTYQGATYQGNTPTYQGSTPTGTGSQPTGYASAPHPQAAGYSSGQQPQPTGYASGQQQQPAGYASAPQQSYGFASPPPGGGVGGGTGAGAGGGKSNTGLIVALALGVVVLIGVVIGIVVVASSGGSSSSGGGGTSTTAGAPGTGSNSSGPVAATAESISAEFPGMVPASTSEDRGYNDADCSAHTPDSPAYPTQGTPDFGNWAYQWDCYGGGNNDDPFYTFFVYETAADAEAALSNLPSSATKSTDTNGGESYTNYKFDDSGPKMVTVFGGDRGQYLMYTDGIVGTIDEVLRWWRSAPLN